MKRIFLILIFLTIHTIFSQEKIVKRYDNGNIQYEGFVVNNTFDSIYKEYYPNGNLKVEGNFKNCEYKINNRVIKFIGCGVVFKDSLRAGKRNGTWKEYYENKNLKSISNYYCGIEQGNYTYFLENGNVESVDFYDANRKIISQSYTGNHVLEEIQYFDVKWFKNKRLESKRTIEFYENGYYKSETLIETKEDGHDYENYKEYYPDGFLKSELVLIDGDKHGICSDYYSNGNIEQVGFFEYDKPVYVQLFYNVDGIPKKLERWKKGKLISTEINFDINKAFKYKVKKYKD